jgi:hypothetical protein
MRRRIYQYETRSGRDARWIAARSPEDAHREARKHGWRPLNGRWDEAEILGGLETKGMKPSQLRMIGCDVVLS